MGCCYHYSFPRPQEHRLAWLTSLAVQLAVFPVLFLISCLLTIRKNKWSWPPTPHQPYQYLLTWLLLQNHVIACMFVLLSQLYYSSEIEIIAFPSLCLSWHRICSTETKSSQSMAIDWRMMSWLSCIDLGYTYPAEEIKGSQTGPLKSEKDNGCRLHRDNHIGTIGNVVL